MEIREQTISDAYTRIMHVVLRYGDLVEIPGYGETLEYYEPIMTHILRPDDVGTLADLPFSESFLIEYSKELTDPTVGNDFAYTYAKRLFQYPGGDVIDQIAYMINCLNEDETSRRAIAVIRHPMIDIQTVNQPCLTTLKCHIFDGRLDMTAYFRSHDIHLGFPANAFGLAYLQQYILNELDNVDIQLGQLVIISDSPHVYINRDKSTIETFRRLNYGC